MWNSQRIYLKIFKKQHEKSSQVSEAWCQASGSWKLHGQRIPKWCVSVSRGCIPWWVRGRQETTTGRWRTDNCGACTFHKPTRWTLVGSLHSQRDACQLQRNGEAPRPHRKGSERHESLAAVFSRKAIIIKRSWRKSQWVYEATGVPVLPGGSRETASPAEAEDQKPHLCPGPKMNSLSGCHFQVKNSPLLLTNGAISGKFHKLSEPE